MAKETPKSSTSGTLKPILRVACDNVKKKAVRFCEELNEVLLITPRKILRRSRRNKDKTMATQETAVEKKKTKSTTPSAVDTPPQLEPDPTKDSCLKEQAQKISSRLNKALSVNNSRASTTRAQRDYYAQVKSAVERRVIDTRAYVNRSL